jgi:hypothetical protein
MMEIDHQKIVNLSGTPGRSRKKFILSLGLRRILIIRKRKEICGLENYLSFVVQKAKS